MRNLIIALVTTLSATACGGKKPEPQPVSNEPAKPAETKPTEPAAKPAEADAAAKPAADAAAKPAEADAAKPAEADAAAKPAEADAAAKPAEADAAKPAEADAAAKPAEAQADATPTANTPSSEALMDPAKLKETAPATYKVNVKTTKGDFVIQVNRDWAPNGADRFYNLVKNGYYKNIAFFRVIEGFMAQFGIHGDPKLNTVWRDASIPDDPAGKQSNTRGRITFATRGPNTRTVQLFINFADNNRLDQMGFSPFGEIDAEGMKVVDSLFNGYGEGAPRGRGPDQGRLQSEGNTYLKAEFGQLDYLISADIAP